MRRFLYLLPILLLAGCGKPSDTPPPPVAAALFNGTDLTGWTPVVFDTTGTAPEVWTVDPVEGILICKGEPWGYLRTNEKYGDYVLDLEWRWNPETKQAGNSGVFLRIDGPDKQWPRLVEVQLKDGLAGDFVLMDGMTMEAPRPSPDIEIVRLRSETREHPVGEWNQMRVTAHADTIRVEINGAVVNEGTAVPVPEGYIALQSEGGEIQYRNIRLTPVE